MYRVGWYVRGLSWCALGHRFGGIEELCCRVGCIARSHEDGRRTRYFTIDIDSSVRDRPTSLQFLSSLRHHHTYLQVYSELQNIQNPIKSQYLTTIITSLLHSARVLHFAQKGTENRLLNPPFFTDTIQPHYTSNDQNHKDPRLVLALLRVHHYHHLLLHLLLRDYFRLDHRSWRGCSAVAVVPAASCLECIELVAVAVALPAIVAVAVVPEFELEAESVPTQPIAVAVHVLLVVAADCPSIHDHRSYYLHSSSRSLKPDRGNDPSSTIPVPRGAGLPHLRTCPALLLELRSCCLGELLVVVADLWL